MIEDKCDTKSDCESTASMRGGRRWLILASTFFIQFLFDGATSSYGIFFLDISEHYGKDRATTASAGSLSLACSYMIGCLLVVFLAPYFGYRRLLIVGSLLAAVSYASCAVAESFVLFQLLYGFVFGTSYGIVNLASCLTSLERFSDKKTLASGIFTCGGSMGVLLLAPLVSAIRTFTDWRGAFLILGALMLNGLPLAHLADMPDASAALPCLMTCEAPERQRGRKRKHPLEFKPDPVVGLILVPAKSLEALEYESPDRHWSLTCTWRKPNNADDNASNDTATTAVSRSQYASIGIVTLLCSLHICLYFFILMYAKEILLFAVGNEDETELLTSTMGVASLVGKLLMVTLSLTFNPQSVHAQSCIYLICTPMALCILLADSVFLACLASFAVMTVLSMLWPLGSVIIFEIVGKNNLGKVYGFTCVLKGVSLMLLGPLFGLVIDASGTPVSFFMMVIGLLVLCTAFSFTLSFMSYWGRFKRFSQDTLEAVSL